MLSNEALAIQQLFFIQNKEGTKVPFALNLAQQFLDKEENNRIIIAKARQKGFSSGILAKFAIRCLGREGTHAVVMSHEASATQRLLDKVQYYLKYIKGPKPVFGRNSRNELYFPRMESTYYIGTAGAKAFGRGDWITDLHLSEYAWYEAPSKLITGVFQAVPMTGRIVIESTGNGRNNDFYYIWKHADSMDYKRLFFPWFGDEEYQLPVARWRPDLPRYNGYLLDVQKRFKLSDQRMAWYEMKLKQLREDLKSMQQEYPNEPDECFQATGGVLFTTEQAKTPLWIETRTSGYFSSSLKGHPQSNRTYVIGCDPSGGTGNDDTAILVFCCETQEQVLELLSNKIDPVECGRILAQLGSQYNNAYIIPEGNNHGIAAIKILRELYDHSKIYKSKLGTLTTQPKYGWYNNRQSKYSLVGLIKERLSEVTLYGAQTVSELNSFEETVEGKLEGTSDNCVIATGLGMLGLEKFKHLYNSHLPRVVEPPKTIDYMTYTLDEVLASIQKRTRGGSWFEPQTGVGYS